MLIQARILRASALIALTALLALSFASCGGVKKLPNPSGTLEATEIDIAPVIGGRVLRVGLELGGIVKAGDTLLVIDTELIRLQRNQAEAGAKSISAQKAVAKDGLDQASRNLDFLNDQVGRVSALVKSGAAPQQTLDEVTTKRDVTSEQVSGAKNQLAAFDAEMSKLEAMLAVFDRQLKDGVVVAPTGGSVILRSVEPGEVITPGKVVLRIADLTKLELRVFLGATELANVKIGQTLPVLLDALPGKPLNGTVTWISAESEFTPKNAQTRDARIQLVYAMKLSLSNVDGTLHIGMPAEVKF